MDLVDSPGVVEDALGERGLARVDVSRDPDVAELLHGFLPPWILIILRSRQIAGGEAPEVEGPEERGGGGRRRRGSRRRRLVESVKKAWHRGTREARHGGLSEGFG